MKKRAKFVIDIMYDPEEAARGRIDPETIDVLSYDIEGEEDGLLLAFIASLTVLSKKDVGKKENFKMKVNALTSLASALLSGITTFVNNGVIKFNEDTLKVSAFNFTLVVGYLVSGLQKVMGLNNEEVKDITKKILTQEELEERMQIIKDEKPDDSGNIGNNFL